MSKRRTLKITAAFVAVIGASFFAYPFASSLKPSAKAENESYVTVKLPTLEPGVVKRIKIRNNYLFLLRPNQEQIESISLLDGHVWDKTTKYNNDLGLYVYWGHSTKWGCPLENKEPQESLILHWNINAKWLGGYWDGWCEVSYDYAGRAIKTWEYTYNGYTFQHENLKVPTVFRKAGDNYLVSIYQR
jgi:Rieske Fe-S protein